MTCAYYGFVSEIVFFSDTYINLQVLLLKNILTVKFHFSKVNSIFFYGDSVFMLVFTVIAENSGPWTCAYYAPVNMNPQGGTHPWDSAMTQPT